MNVECEALTVYEITPEFINYIKSALASKGLSLKKLAELNNMSYTALTKKLSTCERYVDAEWFNITFKPVGILIDKKTGRVRKVRRHEIETKAN